MSTPNDQPRHLQSVSNQQVVLELECGHRVRANSDILDYVPPNHGAMVRCSQCDHDNIGIDKVINAGDIKPAYAKIINVKELDDELRDVYDRIPFIVFHNLVYVPYQQSQPDFRP